MIELDVALAGAAVGFVVGLTGMGGGALLTPTLVIFYGVPPLTAVSSDIVASAVIRPVGAGVHLRRGAVDMGLVTWLVVGSVPSAFLSVWLLKGLTTPGQIDAVVELAVGAALILAAVGLGARVLFGSSEPVDTEERAVHVYRGRTLAIGVFGGAMVGLTSVGSGSLMMALLIALYPALTARQLVGTDLVQATPMVAAAAVGHLLFGDVDLWLTASLLVGAVPAVYLGASVSTLAPDRVIRPLIAVALVASGLKLIGVSTVVVGAIALGLLLAVAGLLTRPAHRRA